MPIVDLTEEHEPIFLACMKGWCNEHLEAGDRKANWCRKMAARGLRVKLANDDAGQPAGLIQYLPIEESNAEGSGLDLILRAFFETLFMFCRSAESIRRPVALPLHWQKIACSPR